MKKEFIKFSTATATVTVTMKSVVILPSRVPLVLLPVLSIRQQLQLRLAVVLVKRRRRGVVGLKVWLRFVNRMLVGSGKNNGHLPRDGHRHHVRSKKKKRQRVKTTPMPMLRMLLFMKARTKKDKWETAWSSVTVGPISMLLSFKSCEYGIIGRVGFGSGSFVLRTTETKVSGGYDEDNRAVGRDGLVTQTAKHSKALVFWNINGL
mmetsp:Transcript_38647/g.93641  ORF Transcript_38647/g.93641 Transcript_38647/m.93641 type:complete len:206 (+) Transcript_38647:1117-1734(+)